MVDLREIAEAEELDYIETTSERNGYPRNIKGAIKGFDTFEKAEEIAKKYGLEIESFEKKDGWQLWYRTGSYMSGPFKNSSEDYGDDYSEIPYGVYDPHEESDFIENEVLPQLDDATDFSEIRNILESAERLWEEIQKLKEGEVIITYLGDYYETIKRVSMYFYHDTNHYVIGLINKE
jgi:hypothetical protein